MEDTLLGLIGVFMIYVTGHFLVISFRGYNKLTGYKKFLTIAGTICIGLVYLGTMM